LELRRQRVELASVIHQAVETVRPAAESAGHELSISLPLEPVYLDADPILFSNLLNNACKYTPGGGHIWLSAQRQGSEIAVMVKDNGIGIPAHMLPHIFQMFTQVHESLERSQGGLGIGLTLVQRLVHMHGGAVQAASDGPGRGSEFTVRLPVLREKPEAVVAPAAGAAKGERFRILVVDDNRDSATSLAMLLKISGHDVSLAHDGEAALEAAASSLPDVMLLDIGLPKLSGYEAARRIRAQPWGQKMLLIAATGWGQEEDRLKSKEAGFDFHLVKPINLADLNALLANGRAGQRPGT
jgi:CheY-like chemotaxis protein